MKKMARVKGKSLIPPYSEVCGTKRLLTFIFVFLLVGVADVHCSMRNLSALCSYSCPPNSIPKKSHKCPKKFRDCRCEPGLCKENGECRANRCPEHSFPKRRSQKCVTSAKDCKCHKNFRKKNGLCIEKEDVKCGRCRWPAATKPAVDCVKSPEDCECPPSHYMDRGRCHFLGCDYACPANSHERVSPACWFGECDCDYGYFKRGETCVKYERDCSFKCPRNSKKQPLSNCVSTFEDCICNNGYHRFNGKCSCKEGYFKMGRKCVRCNSGFQCPERELNLPIRIRSNVSCPTTVYDCQCYNRTESGDYFPVTEYWESDGELEPVCPVFPCMPCPRFSKLDDLCRLNPADLDLKHCGCPRGTYAAEGADTCLKARSVRG